MRDETRGLGLAPATADDYRELARRRLPRHLFDYLDGAAYEEATAAANRDGFRRLQLRPLLNGKLTREIFCKWRLLPTVPR